MDDDRFDGLYMNVAQTAHGIEPLLDTVFSFLRRKTDFFAGPPGIDGDKGTEAAIAKVHQVLQKHADKYKQDMAAAKAKQEASKKKQQTKKTPASPPPTKQAKAADKDDDVIEMGQDGNFDVSDSNGAAPEKKKAEETKSQPATAETAKVAQSENTTKDEKKTDDDDDEKPPVGNGGTVPGKYVWTQALAEVAMTIPVPENTRGRDLSVTIQRQHLKVGLKKTQPIKWIIDAPLVKPIIVDDSFWTVEDGNRLVITLQKVNQMEWWKTVCVGDPTINIQNIQPENSSLNDLDGETRQTVEKMMFDQRQKAMGLPTTDEQQKLDLLKKFQEQHPEM